MTQNTDNGLISPIDAMPTDQPDTDAQKIARHVYANEVRNVLLDPKKIQFTSRDAVELTWTTDGGKTWETQLIPIKSVSTHIIDEINEKYAMETRHLPTIWDEEKQVLRVDTASPHLSEFVRQSTVNRHRQYYELIVHGYDGDLEAIDNTDIVWSSRDASKCDFDRAIEVWHALGLSTEAVGDLGGRIEELSRRNRREELDDFEKKLQPDSPSPDKSLSP